MENETQKIIKEQVGKLPKEIISFLSSANWSNSISEIGSLYNLSETELFGFKREVTLVLAGIVHPDEFKEILEHEVGLRDAILEAVAGAAEQKIFASIRPALIKFFKDEDAKEAVSTQSAQKNPSIGAAPANIPTGIKEESLFPPLVPKVITPKIAVPETILMHPFEEKLQRAPVGTPTPISTPMPSTFTPAATPATQTALVIPVAPQSIPVAPSAPQGAVAFTPAPNGSARGTITHDPYREPVE